MKDGLMSISLDPVVVRRLEQFARRRRLLLAAGGSVPVCLRFCSSLRLPPWWIGTGF
jgi:hypothetical protein